MMVATDASFGAVAPTRVYPDDAHTGTCFLQSERFLSEITAADSDKGDPEYPDLHALRKRVGVFV